MIDRDLVPATFISPGAMNFSLLIFLERGTPSSSTEVPLGRCPVPWGCPGHRGSASRRAQPPFRAQSRGLRISYKYPPTHFSLLISVATLDRKVHLANLSPSPRLLSFFPPFSIIKSAPAMSGGQQIIKCGTFETAQPRENLCN